MYFHVLVTKFAYLFTQGSPTWSGFSFRSYDHFFFGHNSLTKRVPPYSNLVSTNDQVLLPVLEIAFSKSQLQNASKNKQYLIRPEGILKD